MGVWFEFYCIGFVVFVEFLIVEFELVEFVVDVVVKVVVKVLLRLMLFIKLEVEVEVGENEQVEKV